MLVPISPADYRSVPKIEVPCVRGPYDGHVVRMPITATAMLVLGTSRTTAAIFGTPQAFEFPRLRQGQWRALYERATSETPELVCVREEHG